MSVRLNPYVNLRDGAADALEFYRSVFGGDVLITRFAEFAGSGMPIGPEDADKVMHGQLNGPDGLTLMVSDLPSGMAMEPGGNVTISLSGDDDATLRGWWDGLLAGATETMPLNVAPWGDAFGALTDRFGVRWLVNISGGASAGEA